MRGRLSVDELCVGEACPAGAAVVCGGLADACVSPETVHIAMKTRMAQVDFTLQILLQAHQTTVNGISGTTTVKSLKSVVADIRHV
jgi:hypothetical protein